MNSIKSMPSISRSLANGLAAALLLAAALPAYALSSDRNQPVQLEAREARLDNATGVSVYTGDVVLVQGTLRITGDKMTVHTGPGGTLRKVVVEGERATFRQLPDGEQQYMNAQAPRMEYQASEPRFVDLSGGAELKQGKNTFSGEHIRYDIEADRVDAQSKPGSQERIQIIFHPEDKPDAKPE